MTSQETQKAMDYYEELDDENVRLKIVLRIKENELKAARKVVYDAYWNLVFKWQSHMIDVPSSKPFRVNMSCFEPYVYQNMDRSDQALYDALAGYELAMGGLDETTIRAALLKRQKP